ncbi:TPA: hypothetical protein ACN7Z8_003766 [Klebsiella pneumoniae]
MADYRGTDKTTDERQGRYRMGLTYTF